MLLSHNTDFDYWTLASMEYKINRKLTKEQKKLEDSVKYKPLGAYSIVVNEKQFTVSKIKAANEMEFGFKNPTGKFDFCGARKKAYRMTQSKILAEILDTNQKPEALKGGEAVKIYNNKK